MALDLHSGAAPSVRRQRPGPRVAAVLLALMAVARAAAPAKSCLDCHGLAPRAGDSAPAAFTDAAVLAASAHGAFACADCHEGLDGGARPHRAAPVAVDCGGCHEGTGRKAHGFHPRLAAEPPPAGEDTSCTGCHGTHEVRGVRDAAFPFAVPALTEACGRCHTEARDRFVASAHGAAGPPGRGRSPDCLGCHREPVTPRPGKDAAERKLAQERQCETCHGPAEPAARRGSRSAAAFASSVHGAALRAGDPRAPNCVDCHGAHAAERIPGGGDHPGRGGVAAACGRCHQEAEAAFRSGVHAEALARGAHDAPTCTDCHGEHAILAPADPRSPVHRMNLARQVCADCHASLRLTGKYGLAAHAFQTFADSYHGLAVRGGAVEVVNCASCHEAHAIRAPEDPRSSVHRDNLAATCGQCHPGANARFALGKVHVSPAAPAGTPASEPVLRWVALVYTGLIVGVVGLMAGHNALDFTARLRRKIALQRGRAVEVPAGPRLYLRMTLHERLQHGVLMLSFTALVVSGFMLRYPEAWWVEAIRQLSTRAFEWRGLVHRGAGIVLLAAGVWHAAYLAATARGRELLRDLRPRVQDLADPFRVTAHNLGLRVARPVCGRFGYVEKLEYWAMIWGSVLMGLTGVILWADNTSLRLLSKLGFDVARAIHYYEAILATLAILVWHLYFVVFSPSVYPMNLAWLTGRLSEREMLEEHPAELARLRAAEAAERAGAPPDPETPRPPDSGGPGQGATS